MESVIWVETFNFPYNFCFAGAIDLADIVMAGFALNRNGVHARYFTAHNGAGGMGGFDCDIENRMRHVR